MCNDQRALLQRFDDCNIVQLVTFGAPTSYTQSHAQVLVCHVLVALYAYWIRSRKSEFCMIKNSHYNKGTNALCHCLLSERMLQRWRVSEHPLLRRAACTPPRHWLLQPSAYTLSTTRTQRRHVLLQWPQHTKYRLWLRAWLEMRHVRWHRYWHVRRGQMMASGRTHLVGFVHACYLVCVWWPMPNGQVGVSQCRHNTCTVTPCSFQSLFNDEFQANISTDLTIWNNQALHLPVMYIRESQTCVVNSMVHLMYGYHVGK